MAPPPHTVTGPITYGCRLPFALSELIELPPHAPSALLAEERLLPTSAYKPPEPDEEGADDEGDAPPGAHPDKMCDMSGQDPIVGWRYNKRGADYDLCEAMWLTLPAHEQALFDRIPPPASAPEAAGPAGAKEGVKQEAKDETAGAAEAEAGAAGVAGAGIGAAGATKLEAAKAEAGAGAAAEAAAPKKEAAATASPAPAPARM